MFPEGLPPARQQAGVFSISEARKLLRQGRKARSQASRLFHEELLALGSPTSRCPATKGHGIREKWLLGTGCRCHQRRTSKIECRLSGCSRERTGCLAVGREEQRCQQACREDRALGVELLTSGDIQSVKQCAAENCGWLSIDHSRNRNRRWCEMRTCGSQHKARAYYRRKTAGFQRRKLRRSSASTVAF